MAGGELAGRQAESRDFRGLTLDGTDFDGRDLRGADFTGASLRSARFGGARLGVRPRVGVAMLAAAIGMAVAAGVAIGWSVDGTRDRLTADAWDEVLEGGVVGLVLVLLVGVIVWRGFDLAIKVVAVAYPTLVILAVLANALWEEVELDALARATLLVVFLVLAVGAGILGRVIGGIFGSWAIAVVAVLGGLASGRADGGAGGIVVALSLVLISKRALRGDDRDRTLRRLAHRLVRRWGTRLVDADLTGADFTDARAGECDLRGAILDGTSWDPDHPPVLDDR